MKFADKRAVQPKPTEASHGQEEGQGQEVLPAVETLGTLILERRGSQRRTRYIAGDGAERVTEWREIDHGMFAQAAELLKLWKDELLGGAGRIPPSAARVYR